jgi:hypothetical protein
MKQLIVFTLLFTSTLQGLYSQIFQEDYTSRQDSALNEGEIFLDLQASTFFYNNEFFNPFYPGYTLIGANFQPRLVYQSSQKLRFSLGTNLRRYYGDSEKTSALPMLSIEYTPRKNFSILMGSFNGGENHGLHEALFSFENHLTDLVENGILIRYTNSRIKTETWLNWESYIEPGDTFREAFTAGSSNRLMLFESSGWELSAPVCLLAHHAGGQINNNNQHVETLINANEGLNLARKFSSKRIQSIYTDLSFFQSAGDYIPSGGTAFSLKAGMSLNRFELNAEYFKGNDFMSFAGNPLIGIPVVTLDSPVAVLPYNGDREMFNFKAAFKQKIGWNSFLFLRFEGYYFTSTSKLDYTYSLHFQLDDFLRLGKVNK